MDLGDFNLMERADNKNKSGEHANLGLLCVVFT